MYELSSRVIGLLERGDGRKDLKKEDLTVEEDVEDVIFKIMLGLEKRSANSLTSLSLLLTPSPAAGPPLITLHEFSRSILSPLHSAISTPRTELSVNRSKRRAIKRRCASVASTKHDAHNNFCSKANNIAQFHSLRSAVIIIAPRALRSVQS